MHTYIHHTYEMMFEINYPLAGLKDNRPGIVTDDSGTSEDDMSLESMLQRSLQEQQVCMYVCMYGHICMYIYVYVCMHKGVGQWIKK
jgi:hypothetical protein